MKTISLQDFYGYQDEIDNGYIKTSIHPDNSNIIILNYTEKTTFERHWNKYTLSARGLILDIENVVEDRYAKVLAEPFPKFFNIFEYPEYEKDIDFNQIETVTEKIDGSLGISYVVDGEIRFATRGSFISEQAEKATEIWKKKYGHKEKRFLETFNYEPPTLLVEIIYPENRVVVDYKDREELVLLGVIGIKDYEYGYVKFFGDVLDMPVVPQYKMTLEEMLEKKKEISANEEGWIVRFKNGKRLKIKGDEYIKVHKVFYGLSDKAKVEAWKEQRMNEYIMMLPEEFRPELEELAEDLEEQAVKLQAFLTVFAEVIKEKYPDRKDFAIKVNGIIKPEFHRFMFEYYGKDEIKIDSIRDHMYKNYQHFLEVIAWNKNQDSCN